MRVKDQVRMKDTANNLVTEQGKLRRGLAAVFAWLQAMDYTSFDYTLDRIERLEREAGQLKEGLRQSRDTGPVDAHNGSALGSNIDGTARKQNVFIEKQDRRRHGRQQRHRPRDRQEVR
jgi:hypothetical protein